MLPNHPACGISGLHPDYRSHAQRFSYLVQQMLLMGIFSINIFIKLFLSLALFQFQFLSQIKFVWYHYFKMFLCIIWNWSWKETNTLSMAECLPVGIIEKENYTYTTFLSVTFFGLVVWVSVCGMVPIVCTDNQLTICSNKQLTSCPSFYDCCYCTVIKQHSR